MSLESEKLFTDNAIHKVLEVNEVANNDSLFVNKLNEELKSSKSFDRLAKNITAIDMSSLLTKDQYYLLDDHMNVEGHRVIADAIQKAIQKVGQ